MSDVKLDNNSVILEGNVGIGTNNPTNQLHVVGSGPVTIENPNGESDILFISGNNPSWQVGTNSEGWYVWDNAYRLVVTPGGETHSRGSVAGFSFSDRKNGNSERWIWYAEDGKANLWSQKFGRNVLEVTNKYSHKDGDYALLVSKPNHVSQDGDQIASLSPESLEVLFTLSEGLFSLTPLYYGDGQQLVINQGNGYGQVKIEGNVQVTGALTQASSIALKENVAELSGQEAMAALQGLNAVKYNYKADSQKEQRIGFIAEDVPDLVASSERDRLSPMDLIAVLTKAVQEQQKTIAELSTAMKTLKLQEGGY